MNTISEAAGWLSQWFAKVQYGTVPAWFGGASLLLAFHLFLRDRRRDDREQIDKTAVWMSAEWDQTLAHRDFNRSVEPTEEVKLRICEKNSNDAPIHLVHVAFLIETSWCVCVQDDVLEVVKGTQADRLFLDGSLLAPGEQRDRTPTAHYVGHQAPPGATGLTLAPHGVRCTVDWFLAVDNAGRRWEVRPGQGKRDAFAGTAIAADGTPVDGRTRLPIL
jgi:hypothetical protein